MGLAGPLRAAPARRVCLAVGISRYLHGPDLPSALPDAELVARAMASVGFDAYVLRDPTQDDLLTGLAGLRLRAAEADAALAVIYVAAHGFMRDGQGHVLPSDAPFAAGIPGPGPLPEAVFLQAISDRPRQRILFLDSCRDSAAVPRDRDPSFRQMTPHALGGVHVGYATQPGAPALDGEGGHSPFARALHRTLARPGLELGEMSRQIRLDVLRATGGLQIPWERSSLLAPVYLNPGP